MLRKVQEPRQRETRIPVSRILCGSSPATSITNAMSSGYRRSQPYFEFEGVSPYSDWDEASHRPRQAVNERSRCGGRVRCPCGQDHTAHVLCSCRSYHCTRKRLLLQSSLVAADKGIARCDRKAATGSRGWTTSHNFMSKTLLKRGPCFFIIDAPGKDRFHGTGGTGKLLRFVEFMLAEPGAYFVLCGERRHSC
jgi:hypothetical protein